MVPVKIVILGSRETGKTGAKLLCVCLCVCERQFKFNLNIQAIFNYLAASHGTFVSFGNYLDVFPPISHKIKNKSKN